MARFTVALRLTCRRDSSRLFTWTWSARCERSHAHELHRFSVPYRTFYDLIAAGKDGPGDGVVVMGVDVKQAHTALALRPGTAMMVTSLILWTVKRRAKLPDPERPHLGFRLVERPNIGVIAGSMAGVPVYFLANRMLPLETENRAHWQIHSFFIAWGAVFLWSLRRSTKSAWLENVSVGGLLYALVPIVSAATTGRSLVASLVAGDWIFVCFDLTMLATSALMGLGAWKLAHRKPVAIRRARREATA